MSDIYQVDLERRVVALEQQVAMLMAQAGLSSAGVVSGGGVSDFDASLIRMMAANKKILAVKEAREHYGLGLAEAKHYVENLPTLR